MNPIRTNKPIFFGDNGEVLKSGNIYIGQPNQWPLSFPKTVTFQDSAGSQFTAAQPLRTNSQGRIEYNGKAVMALVDGNYSMLVRDRNGVTVADGYTPFVSNAGSGGGSTEGVTQVGLLLSDIKQLNVTPGETVRNVGKSTTLDGLGADWLVVSATGSPGDDVDLIDFANGTQGQRIGNELYSKDVGTENGDVPQYREETVELGGQFDAGQSVKCTRLGDQVTIGSVTGILTHVSSSSALSTDGILPTWARPASGAMQNCYMPAQATRPEQGSVNVTASGRLATQYNDASGSFVSRTDSIIGFSITFNV
jgi:hypothetical protein